MNQRHLSESQDVAGVQSQAILAMEERMRKSEEVAKENKSFYLRKNLRILMKITEMI